MYCEYRIQRSLQAIAFQNPTYTHARTHAHAHRIYIYIFFFSEIVTDVLEEYSVSNF
jgi:hypothetical protein